MSDKNELLKSIDDSRLRLFVAKGLDRAEAACRRKEPYFSDFADPVSASRLRALAQDCFSELDIRLWGGYKDAERLMVGFFPEFCEEYDFPIETVLISCGAYGTERLSHRDLLGSVLGLGIERDRTGDIILRENEALIFVETYVADFVAANLEKVGRTRVGCAVTEDTERFTQAIGVNEIIKTAASERVDAVLSAGLGISRGKASDAVKAGKVFVNWQQITSSSKKLVPGDVVTLRGTGRLKILDFLGKTKKDRLKIKLIKY